MASVKVIALYLCIGASLFALSDAVSCYVCNSHEDAQGEFCNDPFDPEQEGFNIVKNESCAYCRKYVMKVQKDVELIDRTCAFEVEKEDTPNDCMFSTGVNAVQVEICTCNDRKECNGVGESRSTTIVLLAAALMALAARLIH